MLSRQQCDRFIPFRSNRDLHLQPNFSAQKCTQASTAYSRIYSPETSRYLKFSTTSTEKSLNIKEFIFSSLSKKKLLFKKKQTRKAYRILDAPDVLNNFYINPLDWSQSGKIGIALTQSAYLLNENKNIVQLDRYSNIPIACIKFHEESDLCLIGQNSGRIQIYDTEKSRRIRNINIHNDRVGVIQNAELASTFLTGSKDKLIKLNDIRIKKIDVVTFQGHKGQICGLSSIKYYLASGGNDNKVLIWDLRKNICINEIKQHKSAVKAIAWCPWKTCLLATGGGNQDKKIVLWNGNKNVIQQKIETQAQVTAIQWKQTTKQLISAHFSGKAGYCIVWDGKQPQIKLKGHQGRLLGMKLNPKNHDQICTIAADQTLRFWDLRQSITDQIKVRNKSKGKDRFLDSDFR